MYDSTNPKHQRILVDIVNRAKEPTQFNYWNRAAIELNIEFKENLDHEAWRSRYRYLKDEYKVNKTKLRQSYRHNHDKQERLLSYLKQERTIEFLCKMLDMQEIELLGYIQKLQMAGHDIINADDTFVLCRKLLPTDSRYKLYEGELKEHKICVISDTHLCNKKQQLALLNLVYDECQRRGITTVLHCGDITDGMSKRPEHIYELFVYGADDQAQYVIDNYPRRDGIKTYFITGNHDAWNYAKNGVDIGKMIATQREDMIYLGNQKATLMINNCRIDLFHPMDGSAYAKSYSGQKTIENMRGGDKPNAMFVGHHHKMVYFVDRNVHYCEVPCLCEATKFIEGKRLENTIGAMFPTLQIDDLGNIITFNPETMIFYRTLENDYEIPNNKVYKKATPIE